MKKDISPLIRRYQSRGLYDPSLNYAKGIEDYNQAIRDNDKEKIKEILAAYGGAIGLAAGASMQKLYKSNNQ